MALIYFLPWILHEICMGRLSRYVWFPGWRPRLNKMVYWHSGFASRFEEYPLSIFYHSGLILKGDLHKQTVPIQALTISFLPTYHFKNNLDPSISKASTSLLNNRLLLIHFPPFPLDVFSPVALCRGQHPPQSHYGFLFTVPSHTTDTTRNWVRQASECGRRSKIDIARERMERMSMRA